MKLKVIKQWSSKHGILRSIRFSNTGDYCLTTGSDRIIRLWNPYREEVSSAIATYVGHSIDVLEAVASCDSAFIASAGGDKWVFVWDVSSSNIVRRLRGHVAKVTCVKYNDDSSVLASGSEDNTVRLWDAKSRSPEPIQILSDAKDSISHIDVNGPKILVGSLDGYLRNYDIRQGKLLKDFVDHPIVHCCFNVSANCELVSLTNGRIYLFDCADGELLNHYSGRRESPYKIESAFFSNDSYVISGSENDGVHYWNVVSADDHQSLSLTNHGAVTSFAVHPKLKSNILCTQKDIVFLLSD